MTQPTSDIRYQEIFRQLPGNFLLISPESVILDNSDCHGNISMKPREQVVGKKFFDAYPATSNNQADVIIASHEHVRKHKTPHTMPLIRYDLERSAEDGGGFEVRYWEATHYPILDEDGNLLYILQRTEDVTERHEASQRNKSIARELEEAQERTRFIVESLPMMIWTTRPDGYADFFNNRWASYTGHPLPQLLGWDWSQDVHPDDKQLVLDKWEQAIKTGTDFQVEYRLRRADGNYRWHLIRGVPRKNDLGAVTMWVGGGTDIHDQKIMVEELLQMNEAQALLSDQLHSTYELAESQREMFFNIFMQAPAAITILSGPEHRFDFINPGYQKLFPHRELLGKSVAEALPEVVEQGFVKILDSVYKTGETYFGTEMMLMLDRGNGKLEESYFNFTYQQYKEGGETAGIAVFAFEVTDLVLSRKKLEQLTASSSGDPMNKA